MSGDAATLAFYQREAPHYTASGSQGQSRHLDGFLDRLEPGARILELGCGGGRDAAHMVSRGFDVDPTDGTAAMVRKARERWNLPAREMRFDELEAEAEYDAVWAHASLLHAPRETLADIFQRIHRALRSGGWFFANFKAGEAEGRDRFERYYNFLDEDWLRQSLDSAADWTRREFIHETGGGYDGVQREWIAVIASKAD